MGRALAFLVCVLAAFSASSTATNVTAVDFTRSACDLLCNMTTNFDICDMVCELALDTDCAQSIINGGVWSLQNFAEASASQGGLVKLAAVALGRLAKGVDIKSQTIVSGAAIIQDLTFLGDYDRCVRIPNGTYCHSDVVLNLVDSAVARGHPEQTAARLGFCIPNTCTQLMSTVDSLLDGLISNHMNSSASLKAIKVETSCGDSSFGGYEWDPGAYGMLAVCLALAGIVACATLVDTYQKEIADNLDTQPLHTARSFRVLQAFSLSHNLSIFSYIRPGNTNSWDGVRTLSANWIILGHSLIWPLTHGPGYSNVEDVAPTGEKEGALAATWTGNVIMSGFWFPVDSFFFMSGFLAVYLGYNKFAEKGALSALRSAPLLYIDRWLRITPTYAFILFLYAYLIPMMASGPFWRLDDINTCRQYLWLNLLYVHNFFYPDPPGACYQISWYLTDDMVFYYTVPFIIALALRLGRRVACCALTLLVSASCLYSLVEAYHNDWRAGFFDSGDYDKDYYHPVWTRCPTYLLGAIFALLWSSKHEEITLALQGSRAIRAAVSTGSAFLLLISIYGMAPYTKQVPTTMPLGLMSAYTAFSKPAFTIGVALLSALCFARCGSLIQKFLELPIFGWTGKLSFTVYLVHPCILDVIYGSQVHKMHFSIINYTVIYIATVVSATCVSFVIYMLVEQPLVNLFNLLLPWRQKGQSLKQENEEQYTAFLDPNLDGADQSPDCHEANTYSTLEVPEER